MNHSITVPFELRRKIWLKAGQDEPQPAQNPNEHTILCDDDLWTQANVKARYVSMSMLVRTLWSMWLNDRVTIDGFEGHIYIMTLTEILLKKYINGEIVIDRKDWVK